MKLVIDAHAHVFPDKIAEKAVEGIGSFYDLKMNFDGKVGTLLETGSAAGVDRFIVQSVATTPHQVESINNFIAESVKANPDRLIGFATIHPDYEDIEGELERVAEMGLKGVKLHPDFQRFLIDDDKAMKIYECIEGKMPLLVHTGDYRYEWSKPERMARVLDAFPKLQVIGAHFGGWSEWEKLKEVYAGRRIWVDTSSSLYELSAEKAMELIEFFGEDYVLFGTDYPMWSAADEIVRINSLPLTDLQKEKIFHLNAERLLGI
ncbi:MAG: amidohydrolase [Oscillospiraceae bacterium]|nr:amidohydrolase [Oscillospiraceae bacterium]